MKKSQKGSDCMTEKEKKILKNFALIIPQLSETDKSYLIGLGEGMALRTGQNQRPVKRRAEQASREVEGM